MTATTAGQAQATRLNDWKGQRCSLMGLRSHASSSTYHLGDLKQFINLSTLFIKEIFVLNKPYYYLKITIIY